MSDMSVADEGASPDELLWEPLLFRVYQRSPEERRPLPSVQGGGDAHLAQQEGEVQDHRAQGGIGKAGEGSLGTVIRTYVATYHFCPRRPARDWQPRHNMAGIGTVSRHACLKRAVFSVLTH